MAWQRARRQVMGGGRRGRRLGVARPLQEGRDIGIVLNFKHRILGA